MLAFFALFEEDMNRSAIDDQNNDNINEPQDILEEDVEADKEITMKLFIYPVL